MGLKLKEAEIQLRLANAGHERFVELENSACGLQTGEELRAPAEAPGIGLSFHSLLSLLPGCQFHPGAWRTLGSGPSSLDIQAKMKLRN